MQNRKHRSLILILWITISFVGVWLTRSNLNHSLLPSKQSKDIDALLKEIGSSVFSFGAIAPKSNALYLLYRPSGHTEMVRYDFQSRRAQKIPTRFRPSHLYNWSPNERYLTLVSEDLSFTRPGFKFEQMWVWDDVASDFLAVSNSKARFGKHSCWLGDTEMLLWRYVESGDLGSEWQLSTLLLSGAMATISPCRTIGAPDKLADCRLVAVKDGSVAFILRDRLYRYFRDTGTIREDLALSSKELAGVDWLTEGFEENQLLFCAYKTDSDTRNLFQWDFAMNKLTRLATNHTYNGRALSDGCYTYVENISNAFHLAVRGLPLGSSTNCFVGGYVERYVAASSKDRVYAVATTNAEPRGLWEYNFATRSLTQLMPGNRIPISVAKNIEASGEYVTSFDGLRIPVFIFNPVTIQTNSPIILYIPPRFSQCRKGYEIQPQLLCNLGFQYIGVNYRGSDGYGAKYLSAWDAQGAARDVLDVANALVPGFRSGKRKIFVISVSDGSNVLNECLQLFPQLIAGAVFEGPVSLRVPPAEGIDSLPRLLITLGDNDPAVIAIKEAESEFHTMGSQASFEYIDNYGHFGDDPIRRVIQERSIATFLLEHVNRDKGH